MTRPCVLGLALVLALVRPATAQEARLGAPTLRPIDVGWCAPAQATSMQSGSTPFGEFFQRVSFLCRGAKSAWRSSEPSLADITAATSRAEEAGARNRVAAVQYLARVNHHYHPEAEAALIAHLRGDRCECVRLEAAKA